MKKIIIISYLLINFHIRQVCADVAVELQMRLNKINSFHATFVQKVISVDGDLIQESKGNFWIKRPNLFNWHILSPDESCLVSDGINLWFYNPLLEEVIVTLLSDVITEMPFILITRNNLEDWKRYHINKTGNVFLLRTRQNHKNLKHFSITVEPNGIIQKLTVVEQDGQLSIYQFKEQKSNKVDDNKFKFIPPNGIILDDQRSMGSHE